MNMIIQNTVQNVKELKHLNEPAMYSLTKFIECSKFQVQYQIP